LQKGEAKAAYKATHIDAESSSARNSGAHFAYLEGLLARNGGGSGYIVGSELSAADLCVWEIVDLHLRIYPEEMQAGVSNKVVEQQWGGGLGVGWAEVADGLTR
jgi:glutathione S-transferase